MSEMTDDIEKVISALDCLAHGGGTYDCLKFPCPYGFYGYTDCRKWEIAKDAITLLKEKEAVRPTWNRGKPFCGACGLRIHDGKFCSECGRPILWESR